jgi:photosystem II stability/assembly factor-like uncharacterized protein
MKKSIRHAIAWLWVLLLITAACNNPWHPTTPAPHASATPSPVSTATLTPSPTASPTAESLPATAQLVELHMSDDQAGWAWASDGSGDTWLLHTEDGGITWIIVGPRISVSYNLSSDLSFFLDSDSAWLLLHGSSGAGPIFVRTRDGGNTWTSMTLDLDLDRFEFQDQENGWGQSSEIRGGSWFVRLYQTGDGGLTWTPVILPAPPSYGTASDDPEVFKGCNTCGDSFYYDPSHAMILYSDQYSEPANLVRSSISLDQGKTWHDIGLPLPQPEPPGGQIYTQSPAFVDGRNGFLSVRITNQAFPSEDLYDIFAVYATHDGGLSWALSSVVDNPGHQPYQVAQFFSTTDGFAECGDFLCATHDGAKTWQPVAAETQFATGESGRAIFQSDFVGAQTGWVLSGTVTNTQIKTILWTTGDGGLTWTQLAFTPTPPSLAILNLDQIDMLDPLSGWAWAVDSGRAMLYRTSDGGLTWTDASPKHVEFHLNSSFFLDAQHGWIEASFPTTGESGFLYTADGGETWADYSPAGVSPTAFVFANASDGWEQLLDASAGQFTLSLHETHDSGATWSQVALSAPQDPAFVVTQPGTIPLCRLCGDSAYYDPTRLILLQGNLQAGAGDPLSLMTSYDLGETWTRSVLPLPTVQAADGYAIANPPTFLDDLIGFLPVKIVNRGSLNPYSVLAIYSTNDGGESWTRRPAVLDNVEASDPVQFVSPTDAFVRCGEYLCVTHDAAESWQELATTWSFSPASLDEYAVQWDFIEAKTGWVISTSVPGDRTALWRTENGGQTWTLLTPRLAH